MPHHVVAARPSLRKTGAGNIFIKNLDENIDNKALHDTFAAFGNILSCKVAVDNQGNSLGYGFVHYDTAEAAKAAIEGVNGMLLNDKVVFVGLHIPKRERQAKIDEIKARFTNLYIKNVPLEVDEAEFRSIFEPFGQVTSAVVSKDQDGKSKGFGFVNFEKHEDAAKAVDELHEKDYKGQPLYVARAQRKSEREEELKKSYEQKKYEQTLKYQGCVFSPPLSLPLRWRRRADSLVAGPPPQRQPVRQEPRRRRRRGQAQGRV